MNAFLVPEEEFDYRTSGSSNTSGFTFTWNVSTVLLVSMQLCCLRCMQLRFKKKGLQFQSQTRELEFGEKLFFLLNQVKIFLVFVVVKDRFRGV